MNTKFDINTLKLDRKILENKEQEIIKVLYKTGVDKLTHQELYDLLVDFRGVLNVAGMYNDVIEQQLSDGYVTTIDPQAYISQRMPK